MKKFFVLVSMSWCVNMFGTVRTVSNNPLNLAQYNTIQDAVTASSSGDTVYVHGSATRYAGFSVINKRLTIIGPGWEPMQGFMPFKATIEGDVAVNGAGSHRSEFQGIDFFSSVSMGNTGPDSLRFIRNQFRGAFYLGHSANYNGYVFQDNWFDKAFVSAGAGVSITNFVFQNNIFYADNTNGNFYNFSNCENVLFDHNLWYGPSTFIAPCIATAGQRLTFTNNIFVHRNAAVNISLSTFTNNITFAAGVNNPWDAAYGNSGAGNIANQDPQMVSQAAVNGGTNNPLLDFTIAAGPANNGGSDGKDIGLLYETSGILNWANSRMSRLPVIYNMNITTPIIGAGGTLNVQVEAKRNN